MKIVVIGGTGLIGSKLTRLLSGRGHAVVAAAPNTGVNTLTGEGLAQALAGADVVVDVANSPSFEAQAVLEFFETSGRNLLAAEKKASVRHHVALSVVGTERLLDSGYFRGKQAQENLIRSSAMPYSILHSTQFFEFLGGIAKASAESDTIRLSTAMMQPIASDDVVSALADIAVSAPLNGMVELAGPDRVRMSDLMQRYLHAIGDPRTVVPDPTALYFGAALDDASLVPGPGARIGALRFERWLEQQRRAA